ncbi:MAG: RNA polymerase sporulation sigma factor SigK [Oscillospiraceae bacterium]|nr:RNA polymerase sporulation sigma factor SigK [Oscillospiraceae bacterium]
MKRTVQAEQRSLFHRFRAWLAQIRQRLTRALAPPVHYIGTSQTLPPPLTREEEAALFLRIAEGDEGAREKMIVHNLRLVVYIARKFENTNTPLDDLIGIGSIGLIKAVRTFNPEKNTKLATYASRCIENEILMHLRKTARERSEISLDEPLNVDWDGNELLLSDVLGTEGDGIQQEMEDADERQRLLMVVGALGARERLIIRMRFGLGFAREYTQKEVADQLSISQSYISRLEKRILNKMKVEMMD